MRHNLAARLGMWSSRHRKSAIIGWLLFVVLAAGLGGMSGLNVMTPSEEGAGDSARATRILEDAGLEKPAGEMVMVTSGASGGWKSAARDLSNALRDTGEVQRLQPPTRSEDGKSALISFEMKGDAETAGDRVQPVLDAVDKAESRHGGVTFRQFGSASSDKAFGDLLAEDFFAAEVTAVPLALGILLVAFGAVVAALLPVSLALTACAAAFGLMSLASKAVPLSETTYSVMFLMGLAVGVDYCLFYLRRERDERALGRTPETALRIAAATSGRAVLISGLSVMVAMAGLFLSGMMLFYGFAVVTIIVVLIAMLGSVTVLPALMSWLGDRIEKGRLPFMGRRRKRAPSPDSGGRFAGKLVRPVLTHPKLFAFAAGALLLVLAAPAVGMKTEQLSVPQQLGKDSPLGSASLEIAKTFPGGPSPAEIVVEADDIGSPKVRAAFAEFRDKAAASGEFGKTVEITVHKKENVAEIEVPLAGDGRDKTSRHALETLREDLVPDTIEPAVEKAYVTGELAQSVDSSEQLEGGILPVVTFIAVVTFLIMLFCFRSIVIAVTSIALNLLSVAASYGVMVAVFQHGWGDELFATEAAGAIEHWMPLFVLVILFGLSMDYHVFVVSRIREARDRGQSTANAIAEGIRSTAGAVTSAAIIMVAVFAVFATLSMQDFKQLGVGLAVAVLLDATVVRMVLLPSLMALMGERNWTVPRWLDWLPQISHGEEAEPALAGAPAATAPVAAATVASAGAAGPGAPVADRFALSEGGWEGPGHGSGGPTATATATATGYAEPPQDSWAPPRQFPEPTRDVPAAPDVPTRHLSVPQQETAYGSRDGVPPHQGRYGGPGPEWTTGNGSEHGHADRDPYAPSVPQATGRRGRIAPNGLPYSRKSRRVAGVLQLLLGFLGVGRFYTGHIWTGIAMLLTAGGGMIWALIDGILYFAKSDRTDKKGRILRG
ncbi:MMPL family transporter [Streptomyces sp. NPDC047108]|uniref:MMPL family transporter n=1 Tax=Streptomyces sp. NPDC047108 TaxID=3155025 RepID=UPI0034024960